MATEKIDGIEFFVDVDTAGAVKLYQGDRQPKQLKL